MGESQEWNMKSVKQILATMICGFLAQGGLAGCGSGASKAKSTSKTSEATDSNSRQEGDEVGIEDLTQYKDQREEILRKASLRHQKDSIHLIVLPAFIHMDNIVHTTSSPTFLRFKGEEQAIPNVTDGLDRSLNQDVKFRVEKSDSLMSEINDLNNRNQAAFNRTLKAWTDRKMGDGVMSVSSDKDSGSGKVIQAEFTPATIDKEYLLRVHAEHGVPADLLIQPTVWLTDKPKFKMKGKRSSFKVGEPLMALEVHIYNIYDGSHSLVRHEGMYRERDANMRELAELVSQEIYRKFAGKLPNRKGLGAGFYSPVMNRKPAMDGASGLRGIFGN